MSGFFGSIAKRKAKQRLLAAWVIEGEAAGSKALFAPEDGQYVPVYRDDGFPPALVDGITGRSPGHSGILECGGARLFLESLAGERRLVLCGAGHVAMSVILLGVMLGFEVTVIEDRAAFAERARTAGAHRVICAPFEEALETIPGDDATAFVVMTREHVHDVECLRRILQKPFAYAGMMGSRSRAEQVRRQMLAEGFDPGKVDQLRMPIGLSIGSRTPEEIAVSVAAELISVLNAEDAGEAFPPGMLEELAGHEAAGMPAGVLAMIVEKSGEAPRRPGTRMLVRADGSFLGTVGGGYAEAEILRKAGEMLQEGQRQPGYVRISMKKGIMFCGGEIGVLLLPL